MLGAESAVREELRQGRDLSGDPEVLERVGDIPGASTRRAGDADPSRSYRPDGTAIPLAKVP